jgi:hypothetical protein
MHTAVLPLQVHVQMTAVKCELKVPAIPVPSLCLEVDVAARDSEFDPMAYDDSCRFSPESSILGLHREGDDAEIQPYVIKQTSMWHNKEMLGERGKLLGPCARS